MATILFSAAEFRTQFPGQFLDPPNTDTLLEVYWNTAICYVSADTGGPLSVECRRRVINLVTAHLITIAEQTTAGEQAGFVDSASIDKISVSVQTFANQTQFQWFLSQTPYGQQAYAILQAQGRGSYYGGLNELGSFKRAGGEFTPPTIDSSVAQNANVDVCGLITVPPVAPFTADFGLLGGSNLTLPIAVQPGCTAASCIFSATAPGVAVTVSVWTGSATDVGSRFNIYYWTGDARVAGSGASLVSTNQDPTGATIGAGFVDSSQVTGAIVNDPNVFVLTGFDSVDAQVLNVDIALA